MIIAVGYGVVCAAQNAPPLDAVAPATLDAVPITAQRLAPGDRIAVRVYEAPELATDTRVDAAGAITVPAAGRVRVAGETAPQAEQAIAAKLAVDYLLHPQVQVAVLGFAPQPVSVLGAVAHPGVFSARTFPTLDRMVAAAGGTTPPNAGTVEVVRGGDGEAAGAPAAAATTALTASAAHLPAFALRAGDVVRVTAPGEVVVGGDVVRPGEYLMPATGLSLVEAVSMAGGVLRTGSTSHVRIVHCAPGEPMQTEWVDAGPMLNGHAPDRALAANDMVYVPHSVGRTALFSGITTAVAMGAAIVTGVIIWPRPATVVKTVPEAASAGQTGRVGPVYPNPVQPAPVKGGGGN